MKLRGILSVAAVALLLVAAAGAPASAAPDGPAAKPPARPANLLGAACSPSLSFTSTGPAAVAVNASIDCYSSIDYLQVDVQLRRYGSIAASNVCGTTNWSVSCGAGVTCQPGAYQASAQFQAYSTSGFGDYETYTTPVYYITC